jgi:hypothetical protein
MDGVEEMVSVLLSDVLDTEIVDDEAERNWPAVYILIPLLHFYHGSIG